MRPLETIEGLKLNFMSPSIHLSMLICMFVVRNQAGAYSENDHSANPLNEDSDLHCPESLITYMIFAHGICLFI